MLRVVVRPLLAAVFVLAALGLGAAACADAGPPDYRGKRPIILISIDSLRADHCTPYGYQPLAPGERTTPWLQQLAEQGVTFENASGASPWTLPSHVSLLSGMHPREHGVRTRKQRIGDDLELISGRLQAAGWATAGFFSGPFLHNVWGFGHGFDVYRPSVPYLQESAAGRQLAEAGKDENVQRIHDDSHTDAECAEDVIGDGLEWLRKGDRWREPFFLFLHLWDPHYDYFPPQDYRERFLPAADAGVRGDELMREDQVPNADVMRGLLALYDAEIRYTDDWMARLDAQLAAWGIADEVIILVTSDHGDEFLEHGNRGHHLTLYEEVMHVPMVLRAPGLAPAGVRVQASVSLPDVAPTLLELAGLAPWPERSGRSMRPLWEGAGQDYTVHADLLRPTQGIELLGWREGPQKAIVDGPAGIARLYDLDKDPGERRPQEFGRPFAAHEPLRRALAALGAEPQSLPFPPGLVSEPEHVEAATHQVGYAGD